MNAFHAVSVVHLLGLKAGGFDQVLNLFRAHCRHVRFVHLYLARLHNVALGVITVMHGPQGHLVYLR